MTALIRKYPFASYVTLAIAISWIAVLGVVLPGSMPAPPDVAERLFPYVYLGMLLGPPVAAIVVTAAVHGVIGLHGFRDRLLNWRVDIRWYVVALITAPLLTAVTLFVMSQVSPEFVPAFLDPGGADPAGPFRAESRVSFLVFSIAVGIGAGFFEELGWTGFATPWARRRHGLLGTGVILGVIWGTWHFLVVLWGSAGAFGTVPVPLFIAVSLFSTLPPYRVLMTFVYDRTRSLPVAMLMHASLTSSMLIIAPQLTGSSLVAWDVAFAAVAWIAVAFVPVSRTQHAPAPREAAGD